MRKLFSALRKSIFMLFVVLLLTGCGAIATASPTPDVLATVVAQTLTSMPVNVEPVASATPPATATFTPLAIPDTATPPIAASARYVVTSAENVNLRVNPGRLFKVSRVLAKGTRLQVLGSAPGGEWLNVISEEGIIGWVGLTFVDAGPDGLAEAVISPKDAQLITGQVLDVNGNPVSGIGITFYQNAQRDDVLTDQSGTYYLYIPLNLTGAWGLQFSSISCESSIMDANCQCLGGVCGKTDPQEYAIDFPLSTANYSFTWK